MTNPSSVAKAALSPNLLKYLFSGFAAFESSSLSPLDQEVLAMTVAFENECHYCMALHSATLSQHSEHQQIVQQLREGQPLESPKLEVLRQFVLSVMRNHGRPPSSAWDQMASVGYTQPQVLDVILGIGVYTLSTLSNIVTSATIDPPFAPFSWEKPTSLNPSENQEQKD